MAYGPVRTCVSADAYTARSRCAYMTHVCGRPSRCVHGVVGTCGVCANAYTARARYVYARMRLRFGCNAWFGCDACTDYAWAKPRTQAASQPRSVRIRVHVPTEPYTVMADQAVTQNHLSHLSTQFSPSHLEHSMLHT
mgnify:CR=1 FL=1